MVCVADRLLVGLAVLLHALLGLAVEPDLRDEHREQAEHHGKRRS